jgi:hypothetical protein
MKRAVLLRLLLTVGVLGLIALWGCTSEDQATGPSGNGTIGVYPRPITVAFPWSLSGPDGYVLTGNGDQVIEDLAPGEYELTWEGVSGWFLPDTNPMIKQLSGGLVTTFSATYRQPSTEPDPGQVQINPEPNDIDAPWTLYGPDDLVETGNSDALFEDMDIGTYAIAWGDVDGWSTPLPDTLDLEEGDGITFAATYLELGSGTVVMIPVEPGTFNMGSRLQSGVDPYEWPLHPVTITKGFEVSETEITWAQYTRLIGTNPSQYFELCPSCELTYPVESVSWLDAITFCNALSDDEARTPVYTIVGQNVTWDEDADGYRLLTEAEWEYACRAGTQTDLANGALTYTPNSCDFDENLTLIGWYCYNAAYRPHIAQSLEPNAWGLYDMHGNVWEWVWDWSGSYESVPVVLGDFEFVDGVVETRGSLSVIQFLEDVGDGLMIRFSEVGATFSVSNLGISTSELSFEYADFTGEVNLRVNNDVLYKGAFTDFPAAVAPGVTLSVTAMAIDDAAFGVGVTGVVTFTGDVQTMLIGGETLLMDDMSIIDAGSTQYSRDRLLEFDTMSLGFVYRPAIGSQPVPILMGATISDPIGPTSGTIHMMRGGGYGNNARNCRSASRSLPADKGRYTGFRVGRTLD